MSLFGDLHGYFCFAENTSPYFIRISVSSVFHCICIHTVGLIPGIIINRPACFVIWKSAFIAPCCSGQIAKALRVLLLHKLDSFYLFIIFGG